MAKEDRLYAFICMVTLLYLPMIGVVVSRATYQKKSNETIKVKHASVNPIGHLECPEPLYCQCNWKLQTVSCGNNITYIPKVPSSIRKLYMENSFLQNIDNGTFTNLTNVRLRHLGLSYCGLKSVSKDSLTGVVFRPKSSLSLSGNDIPVGDLKNVICSIPSVNVQWLILEEMSLRALPPGVFECLRNTAIKRLSLMSNELQNFSGNVFSMATKVEYLRLDFNALSSLELINMASLKFLGLRGNPLSKVPAFVGKHGESLCPKLVILDLRQINTGKYVRPSDFKGLQSLVSLYMTSNNLWRIQDNFMREMPHLRKLILKQCLISHISEFAFNSTSLETIDLSDAFGFRKVSTWDIFARCPNLKSLELTQSNLLYAARLGNSKMFSPLIKLSYLGMENTELTEIPDNLFEIFPSLVTLVLSHNAISQWNSTLFSKAKKLRYLYLDYNGITIIKETSFPSDFLLRLTKLYLGHNRFSCTCDIVWFRNWLNQTNITIGDHQTYLCSSPEGWTGKPLFQFEPTVNECTPLNLPVILGASLGSFVFLVALIVVIAVRYRMHIRYIVFLIRSRMKRYTQHYDVNNYCYDAFVVYSSYDRDWVIKELLTRVEYQEGYKLSLYDRDFIPGVDIVDNIVEHMESSRIVIVVLSDNFAKSEWCKWELTMAQNKLLDERKNILILIKLDEIKPEHLNNRLMLLMRDRVYIDWSDCILGQEMFWKRLITALARPPAQIDA